jgi:ribosome-binding factor A
MKLETRTKPKRTVQVAGVLQQEISELLVRKVKDPRLEMVTITGVDISPDLKMARIYFSRFGSAEDLKKVVEGLQSSAGFLRRELGHRMKLRHVPELNFVHDTSFEYGDRIESLLKEINPGKEPVEDQ